MNKNEYKYNNLIEQFAHDIWDIGGTPDGMVIILPDRRLLPVVKSYVGTVTQKSLGKIIYRMQTDFGDITVEFGEGRE